MKKTNVKANRKYAFIAYFFTVLFLAMLGYFIYFQAVLSNTFLNSTKNPLQDLAARTVVRGSILSADGELLSYTQTDTDGKETRIYPYDNLFAHAVGYFNNGKAGLENLVNFSLLTSHDVFTTRIRNDLAGRKNRGDNVYTTLDTALQKAAREALGRRKGAVIVMNPDTGAILAMVSAPDYDPNTLAAKWETISTGESTVLFNRAANGQYTPGSVYKLYTILAYYREHKDDYEDFRFTCTGTYTEGGYTIHCAGGEAHGTQNLEQAFANSCNCAFAKIGLSLNQKEWSSTCNGLLFNETAPGPYSTAESSFELEKNADAKTIMQTAIGQGKTLCSPMQLCELSCIIANDGILMKPYVVQSVRNVGGSVVTAAKEKEYDRFLTEEESSFLQDMMRNAVLNGTAEALKDESYTACGKTGTAELGDGTENGWFTGFAEKDGKKLAIAVVVEKSGAGSRYAVPVAKKVFRAWADDNQ